MKCKNFNFIYNGQTKRKLKLRFKENFSQKQFTGVDKLAVAQH